MALLYVPVVAVPFLGLCCSVLLINRILVTVNFLIDFVSLMRLSSMSLPYMCRLISTVSSRREGAISSLLRSDCCL